MGEMSESQAFETLITGMSEDNGSGNATATITVEQEVTFAKQAVVSYFRRAQELAKVLEDSQRIKELEFLVQQSKTLMDACPALINRAEHGKLDAELTSMKMKLNQVLIETTNKALFTPQDNEFILGTLEANFSNVTETLKNVQLRSELLPFLASTVDGDTGTGADFRGGSTSNLGSGNAPSKRNRAS